MAGGIRYLFFVCFLLSSSQAYAGSTVKEPNVAGAFYPDDPKQLTQMVDGFLSSTKVAPVAEGAHIWALISPHAGYGYSGPTAAYGYKLIQGKPYKTVVILAPSHYYGFSGISVYSQGAFRTPLGEIPIDQEFTKQLLGKDAAVAADYSAFAKEHSLEVQLPFLQRTLTDFRIVPVVIGDASLEACETFAQLLKNAVQNRDDVLVIASTDLYHGYDPDEARATDESTLAYVNKMDANGLYYGLREGRLQMCGGLGVVTALLFAKEIGCNTLTLLHHTNSAEVTGKRTKGAWTVGYASCIIIKEKKGEAEMLTPAQKKRLLEIARGSIEYYLKNKKAIPLTESDVVLSQEMGAFVTLHNKGQLRGCIGNIMGKGPLYLTVRNMAVEAAVNDPRFSAVSASELSDIDIEVSVLSPLQRVAKADEIRLGTHGVLVRKGFYSGVFLPQVATETGWSKEEFLSVLCSQKAGLPPDAWKDASTELYVFTATVFSEKDK